MIRDASPSASYTRSASAGWGSRCLRRSLRSRSPCARQCLDNRRWQTMSDNSPDREPRVERMSADETMRRDATLRQLYQRFIQERGKVPNLFRVAAQRPAISRTLSAHMRAVMAEVEVSTLLKALLSVRVSH